MKWFAWDNSQKNVLERQVGEVIFCRLWRYYLGYLLGRWKETVEALKSYDISMPQSNYIHLNKANCFVCAT